MADTQQSQVQKAVPVRSSYVEESKLQTVYRGGPIWTSTSEEYLFTACDDVVNVTELDNGRMVQKFEGDTEPVTALCVSPDDTLLAISSRSLMLRIWRWKETNCIRAFKAHQGPVAAMAFDNSSTLLATGAADGTVKVWDVVRGYCTHNFKGSHGVVGFVTFLQLGPGTDTMYLYTAAEDYKVRVWHLASSKQMPSLESHVSLVRSVAFACDNKYIVTAGRDKVLNVWHREKRKLLKTIPVYETLEAAAVLEADAEIPGAMEDAKFYVMTAGEKGQLRVFAYPSGDCVYEDVEPRDSSSHRAIMALKLLPKDARCLSASFDGVISTRKLRDMHISRQMVGSYDEIVDVKMAKGYLALATNAPDVYYTSTQTLHTQLLRGHSDAILCLDMSADGRVIVTSSKDNTARVWMQPDVSEDNGQTPSSTEFHCVALCRGHAEAVGAIAISRRNLSFVMTGSKDTTMKLWPLDPLKRLELDADAAGDLPLQLTAKYTHRAHEKDINSIDIAPNEKLIATGSQDRTAKLFRATDGKELAVLKGHRRGVWCVLFSPFDRVLATGSGDTTVRIWGLADYTCIRKLEGHAASVLKLQYISKGTQLLSSSSDGLVKLWSISSSDNVTTLDAHDNKAWSIHADNDGEQFVSAGADGKVVLWRDNTSELEEAKLREKQEQARLTEELENLLQHDNYAAAISLAIRLRQPARMGKIVRKLLEGGQEERLHQLVHDMSDDDLSAVIGFTIDWNTNTKTSDIAQHVLRAVLRQKTPEQLKHIPNITKTLATLETYSERHHARLTALLQQTQLVEYTWQAMRLGPLNIFSERGRPFDKDTSDADATAAGSRQQSGQSQNQREQVENEAESQGEDEAGTDQNDANTNGQHKTASVCDQADSSDEDESESAAERRNKRKKGGQRSKTPAKRMKGSSANAATTPTDTPPARRTRGAMSAKKKTKSRA